jgi:hypothetical protein
MLVLLQLMGDTLLELLVVNGQLREFAAVPLTDCNNNHTVTNSATTVTQLTVNNNIFLQPVEQIIARGIGSFF